MTAAEDNVIDLMAALGAAVNRAKAERRNRTEPMTDAEREQIGSARANRERAIERRLDQ